jgi:hypothetical protein
MDTPVVTEMCTCSKKFEVHLFDDGALIILALRGAAIILKHGVCEEAYFWVRPRFAGFVVFVVASSLCSH